ncbi:hypothetical protein QVD99_007476 [Batrachochytrium dendrobatidis]|nr:hypothetical protein O5D80_008363 [Batrachochytrium dendrobatidis]KAK5665850.1 hypothetical protein QVD99_007476 [Batrachochytrium dendrobatidis]
MLAEHSKTTITAAAAEEWVTGIHEDIGTQWFVPQDDSTLDAIMAATPHHSNNQLSKNNFAANSIHIGKPADREFAELATAEEISHSADMYPASDSSSYSQEPLAHLLDLQVEAPAELLELYAYEGPSNPQLMDRELDYAMQVETAAQSSNQAPVKVQHTTATVPISSYSSQAIRNNEQLLESVLLEQSNIEKMNSLTKAVFAQIDEQLAPVSDDTRTVQDVYAVFNGSRAVDGEEIMNRLLTEARRIQWEHAAATPKPKSTKAVHYLHLLAKKRSLKNTVLSEREKQILFSVYHKLNDIGTLEHDEFLDTLFHKAIHIVDRHTIDCSSKL